MVFGGREGEVKGLVEALVQEELCQELRRVEGRTPGVCDLRSY